MSTDYSWLATIIDRSIRVDITDGRLTLYLDWIPEDAEAVVRWGIDNDVDVVALVNDVLWYHQERLTDIALRRMENGRREQCPSP